MCVMHFTDLWQAAVRAAAQSLFNFGDSDDEDGQGQPAQHDCDYGQAIYSLHLTPWLVH